MLRDASVPFVPFVPFNEEDQDICVNRFCDRRAVLSPIGSLPLIVKDEPLKDQPAQLPLAPHTPCPPQVILSRRKL